LQQWQVVEYISATCHLHLRDAIGDGSTSELRRKGHSRLPLIVMAIKATFETRMAGGRGIRCCIGMVTIKAVCILGDAFVVAGRVSDRRAMHAEIMSVRTT
jgi:hypothetical protein